MMTTARDHLSKADAITVARIESAEPGLATPCGPETSEIYARANIDLLRASLTAVAGVPIYNQAEMGRAGHGPAGDGNGC